jgi:hypothetical protein
MNEHQVWRLYFAASSFWSETLQSVFGGLNSSLGGSGGSASATPRPPSVPRSPFQGDQSTTSYTSHQFPS